MIRIRIRIKIKSRQNEDRKKNWDKIETWSYLWIRDSIKINLNLESLSFLFLSKCFLTDTAFFINWYRSSGISGAKPAVKKKNKKKWVKWHHYHSHYFYHSRSYSHIHYYSHSKRWIRAHITKISISLWLSFIGKCKIPHEGYCHTYSPSLNAFLYVYRCWHATSIIGTQQLLLAYDSCLSKATK